MSTISTALRHFKEPTRDQLTEIFFSLPPTESKGHGSGKGDEHDTKMDINAVLSVGEVEDAYVCSTLQL